MHETFYAKKCNHSNSTQNCFHSGFVSEKTNLGFMSVDIRTTFAQYLKGFLKKIKIPSLPVVLFFH